MKLLENNNTTNNLVNQLKESTNIGPTIFLGMLNLDYTLVSVGNTEEDAKNNLIKNFTEWTTNSEGSIENWVNNIAGEDFTNYNNDTWTFINEFYGASINKVEGYTYF